MDMYGISHMFHLSALENLRDLANTPVVAHFKHVLFCAPSICIVVSESLY